MKRTTSTKGNNALALISSSTEITPVNSITAFEMILECMKEQEESLETYKKETKKKLDIIQESVNDLEDMELETIEIQDKMREAIAKLERKDTKQKNTQPHAHPKAVPSMKHRYYLPWQTRVWMGYRYLVDHAKELKLDTYIVDSFQSVGIYNWGNSIKEVRDAAKEYDGGETEFIYKGKKQRYDFGLACSEFIKIYDGAKNTVMV